MHDCITNIWKDCATPSNEEGGVYFAVRGPRSVPRLWDQTFWGGGNMTPGA